MTDTMPLDDVRVLDLTRHAAGPFATRLLADYGADVIKIEPPEGDPARRLPPFMGDDPGPDRSGMFLFLNTNKRSVVLDLKTDEGRDRFLELARGADVVVENFMPGTLDRLGIGYETLREANPRLVLTSISNFGQDGPYRDWAGTDLTLYAMGGPMLASGEASYEPVKTAGRMTSYHTGLVGALATAVAIRGAELRGEGEHVDVNLYETALHSIDIRLARLMMYQYTGQYVTRPTLAAGVGSGVYPCADGFFLMSNGPQRIHTALRMMGYEDLLETPEWSTVEACSHVDRIDEFNALAFPWLLSHTRAEIRKACEVHGVMAGPINSVADLFEDENFRYREFFQTIDHPETGPLEYPGYHFRLHRPEGAMPERRRAPLLGEHTDEVLAELPRGRPTPAATPGRGAGWTSGDLPLKGVRIVDFTVVLAGPYGAMQLADWGAEVIRVESTQHFASATRGLLARPPQEFVDAMAQAGAGIGYPDNTAGERPWNRGSVFNSHARNKLSMTVDLTRPEGQEVLHRLVEISDGLMENNLPPNIERQGVSWDALSAVNPNLVMVRIPAFGIDGPYRAYRTYGNHMEAIAGHPAIRSYPGLSLEYAPLGVPSDAASGMGNAYAFMMGLRQRERTGKGLLVEVATAENFVPLIGEFIMDYSMNGRLWEQMGNDHWWLAPHNVYRCRGDDAWVTIAVTNEAQWPLLCEAIRREDLADDPRFADMAARYQHRRELDAIIGEWTAERDARWVAQRLQFDGIPAGAVMSEVDAYEDRHLHERGFFQEITHPEAGTHQHVGPAWTASGTPHPPPRHAPLLGQDNEYVYKELLGFSDADYRRFEEMGHIGDEFIPSIP